MWEHIVRIRGRKSECVEKEKGFRKEKEKGICVYSTFILLLNIKSKCAGFS